MGKKHGSKIASFFIKLGIVFLCIASLALGGFFVIDKVVVPSYFKKYGINNLSELVSMVHMMQHAPDEKTFIKNPYTREIELAAVSKLENAGVPVYNGEIEFSKIAEKEYQITEDAKKGVFVSDQEIASIFGQMLRSDYLLSVEYFKKLEYFDAISLESKEIKIEISDYESENDEYMFSNLAKVSMTLKVNTSSAQALMAKQMDVPLFLLDLIMPDYLYLTVAYDLEIQDDAFIATNAQIGINGRAPNQSEILLNMLIKFLFPDSEQMTIEKLGSTFSDSLNDGFKLLGNIKFCKMVGGNLPSHNGIFVYLNTNQ